MMPTLQLRAGVTLRLDRNMSMDGASTSSMGKIIHLLNANCNFENFKKVWK